jgi:hypothetical protein
MGGDRGNGGEHRGVAGGEGKGCGWMCSFVYVCVCVFFLLLLIENEWVVSLC